MYNLVFSCWLSISLTILVWYLPKRFISPALVSFENIRGLILSSKPVRAENYERNTLFEHDDWWLLLAHPPNPHLDSSIRDPIITVARWLLADHLPTQWVFLLRVNHNEEHRLHPFNNFVMSRYEYWDVKKENNY